MSLSRRRGVTQQSSLFDDGPVQTGLDLRDASGAGASGGASSAQVTRLLALERQRDIIAQSGRRTADIDEQIATMRRLVASSWSRNPPYPYSGPPVSRERRWADTMAVRASIEDWRRANQHRSDLYGARAGERERGQETYGRSDRRNPRMPTGVHPSYQGKEFDSNKMFLGPDGTMHPIRKNLKRQGTYNYQIERAQKQARRGAYREGLIDSGNYGSVPQIIDRQREAAARLEAEAQARREVGGQGFEQQFGVRRPTDAAIRGLRARMGHPVVDRQRGDGKRVRPIVGDRDVLRLAAIAKQHDPDLDTNRDDWWDDLSWEMWQQALGPQAQRMSAAELGAGSSGATSKQAADAARRVTELQRRLAPHQANREQLEARLARAFDRGNNATTEQESSRATALQEKIEAEIRSLGRKQRLVNNPWDDNPRDLAAEAQQGRYGLGLEGRFLHYGGRERERELREVADREAQREKMARLDATRNRYQTFTPQAAPIGTPLEIPGAVHPSGGPTALPSHGRSVAVRTFPGGLQYPRPVSQEPHRRFQVGRYTVEEIPDPVERMYTGQQQYQVLAPQHMAQKRAVFVHGSMREKEAESLAARPGLATVGSSPTYRGALAIAERQARGPGRPSVAPAGLSVAQTRLVDAEAIPLGDEIRRLPAFARPEEQRQEAAYHSRSSADAPSLPITTGQLSLGVPQLDAVGGAERTRRAAPYVPPSTPAAARPERHEQISLFNPRKRRQRRTQTMYVADNPSKRVWLLFGGIGAMVAGAIWWHRHAQPPIWVTASALAVHHQQHPGLPGVGHVRHAGWVPSGPYWQVTVHQGGIDWVYDVDDTGYVTVQPTATA